MAKHRKNKRAKPRKPHFANHKIPQDSGDPIADLVRDIQGRIAGYNSEHSGWQRMIVQNPKNPNVESWREVAEVKTEQIRIWQKRLEALQELIQFKADRTWTADDRRRADFIESCYREQSNG